MRPGAVLEHLAEEDLQPIPEILGGIGYRSRLEARWSIFFDTLGVRYDYEPASVILAGKPRWPDFWLPREEVWIEVKPAGVPPDEAMALAVSEQTGSHLVWLSGPPRFGDYEARICHLRRGCAVSGPLLWAIGRRDKSRLWLTDPALTSCFALPTTRGGEGDVPRVRCARLREAYRAAMQYRFEDRDP